MLQEGRFVRYRDYHSHIVSRTAWVCMRRQQQHIRTSALVGNKQDRGATQPTQRDSLTRSVMANIVRLALITALSCYYRFLRLTVRCFLLLFHVGEKKIVPPPRNPILFMSASRLASSIRLGKLLSEDVVKCYIERIREVQPYINAVAKDRYEQALEEARQVDQIIASKTKTPEELAKETPLLGVPITIKLLITVKDMPYDYGSYFFKGDIAQKDAEVTARMKKAGAIILATTNTPEFGMNIETSNWIYGTTNNPYDTRRTPGGSSGGESALISAAGSVLGIGNDLGGSIRFPCLFTGIFGHKPTGGTVSNEGLYPKLSEELYLDACNGPLCRYAEDLALCMKILLSPKHSHMKMDAEVDFSKTKVYYLELDEGNVLFPRFDRDVLNAQQKVIEYFRNAHGTTVKKTKIRNLASVLPAYSIRMEKLLPLPLDKFLYRERYHLSIPQEFLKILLRKSKFPFALLCQLLITPFLPTFFDFSEFEKKLKEDYLSILEDEESVILLPTFPTKAFYHYEGMLNWFCVGYTAPCNFLRLPATQCPVGIGEDGLPVGLQVIAARGMDHLTIAFAREIEKAFGGWVPPNAMPKFRHKAEKGQVRKDNSSHTGISNGCHSLL